ncbi:MAG: hypothetical protein NZ927_05475 [Candidatus Calescibacterium sp.]|nr:hypothetical protein [Candidatus Calescibacterium sp.]MCX7733182.1 hypothetical protein [bacterium]MDW8086889.1 hypothetical protein [Candidatus Calescibacterium sp.]
MLTFILVLNIVFLIITIVFAIKTRADIENAKSQKNKIPDEIDEMKIKLMGLEERINLLEQEVKYLSSKLVEKKFQSETSNGNAKYTSQKVSFNYRLDQQEEREDTNYTQTKYEQNKKTDVESIQNMIINLFNQGKKEDEIANLLGLSFEEVKLTLMVLEKGRK